MYVERGSLERGRRGEERQTDVDSGYDAQRQKILLGSFKILFMVIKHPASLEKKRKEQFCSIF